MSGFSAEWLALREPLDHRSRAPAVIDALVAWQRRIPPHQPLQILDLACGAGSNARALAGRLAGPCDWRFADNDPALLAVAAATFPDAGPSRATTVCIDLAAADLDQLAAGCDLITASALLDLASGSWVKRLWRAVARQQAVFLSSLTYDGRIAINPPHAFDAVIRDLMNRHQRSDKGFGPALGPTAAAAAVKAARTAGYQVIAGTSDWYLEGERDRAALEQLLRGLAEAACETAPFLDAQIHCWLSRRLAEAELKLRIGHRDMLALPPHSAASAEGGRRSQSKRTSSPRR